MASDWREVRPLVNCESDAGGQQEFLAVRSYCEGVILVKERTEHENISPL